MNIARIPADRIATVWPLVLGRIEAALKHGSGEYKPNHVFRLLADGDWQLWLGTDSLCCTSVNDYPARRILYVQLAAGHRGAIADFWPSLRAFAEDRGCGAVQFFGRRGWARSGILPDGARHAMDVVTMELV